MLPLHETDPRRPEPPVLCLPIQDMCAHVMDVRNDSRPSRIRNPTSEPNSETVRDTAESR